jgi:hypothetical protein
MTLLHPYALAIYAISAVLMTISYLLLRRGTPRSRTAGFIFMGLAIAVVAFRIVFPILFILLLFLLGGKLTGG